MPASYTANEQHTFNSSSSLHGFLYNAPTQELFVQILDDKEPLGYRTYGYHHVPEMVVGDFAKAGSAGRYYSLNIKGTYPAYGQIEDDNIQFVAPVEDKPDTEVMRDPSAPTHVVRVVLEFRVNAADLAATLGAASVQPDLVELSTRLL